MSDKSAIEWTEATWNCVRGCIRVSRGCENCYAERLAATRLAETAAYKGLAVMTPGGPRWTGRVVFDCVALSAPLKWRKPRRVFVNSMSDLFHEGLTNEQIAAVFGVMAGCPQHTFQVLTKRAQRMREWFQWAESFAMDQRDIAAAPSERQACMKAAFTAMGETDRARKLLDPSWRGDGDRGPWPLPNVWLGVSAEDQATADARIPLLLETPAAVRWVSAEPLLGPVDLMPWLDQCPASHHVNGWAHGWLFDGDDPYVVCTWCHERRDARTSRVIGHRSTRGLNWVVVGGESGAGARPMHPDWPRLLRDQCQAASVSFFFKQWGNWRETLLSDPGNVILWPDGGRHPVSGHEMPTDRAAAIMRRLEKHGAGRELDGRTWDEYPRVAA